jgi:hypothetical protein
MNRGFHSYERFWSIPSLTHGAVESLKMLIGGLLLRESGRFQSVRLVFLQTPSRVHDRFPNLVFGF